MRYLPTVRPIRLLVLAVTFAAVSAIIATPQAQAMRFADSPCPEAGAGGIRVCPDAVVGQPYALTLEGEGGCGPALPYQYRVLNGVLPPGVSLSKEGNLSGSPSSAGDWDFWLEISDQNPPSASWCRPAKSEREFRIRVAAPAATVDTPYSFSLGAPGVAPGTWSLRAGTLPDGLSLDPAGVLAGVPTIAGSFPLVFSLADAAGHETRRLEFALTVYPKL